MQGLFLFLCNFACSLIFRSHISVVIETEKCIKLKTSRKKRIMSIKFAFLLLPKTRFEIQNFSTPFCKPFIHPVFSLLINLWKLWITICSYFLFFVLCNSMFLTFFLRIAVSFRSFLPRSAYLSRKSTAAKIVTLQTKKWYWD